MVNYAKIFGFFITMFIFGVFTGYFILWEAQNNTHGFIGSQFTATSVVTAGGAASDVLLIFTLVGLFGGLFWGIKD